jgi:hypothetical protein
VKKEEETVGLITLEGMQQVVDAEAHLVFFDRDLASKVELCRDTMRWLFETFPLKRISVSIPAIYYATIRLVSQLGFTMEGRKRQAVLIGGKWIDVKMFGILREEI